jgi:hypothetical protein
MKFILELQIKLIKSEKKAKIFLTEIPTHKNMFFQIKNSWKVLYINRIVFVNKVKHFIA